MLTSTLVALQLLGGAVGVGEHLPGASPPFELDVGQVHGVDHQLPDPSGEHVGVDAEVGGDACHEAGLGDADLAAGECVVPHRHRTPQPCFLHPAVGLGAGQLQAMFHPRLRGEEAEAAERLCGVDMIGHRDRRGMGLAAQLFDAGGPRLDRRRVESGRLERREQRQSLGAVLDHRSDPVRIDRTGAGADGDVGHRIEPRRGVGRIPGEPVAES